ncbi:MAG: ParB/RepB/Spo0J family partition protein [Planctomycetes bacterium]|nr:ParB/RepB/Spo0J family partition protein [Planctomycetota bacterium]
MTNNTNENSGENKDVNKVSGPSNPASPTGIRLGRGLGRLIPVKNQPIGAEKSSVVTEVEKPPVASINPKPQAFAGDLQVSVKKPDAKQVDFGRSVQEIELSKIRPNARQPRSDFNTAELQSLADSIRSSGLLQPIVVRPVDGTPGQFEIVAGERRWRAFQIIGKPTIPAIVIQASDENSGVWALIENIHRTDLNPMDRALSVQRLANEFTLTHDLLAKKISLDRSTVTNLLRLAELDSATASLVRQGLISQGHAKALLGVADLKARSTLADSTIRGEWSVRTLEREVQRLSTESKSRVPRGTTTTARRQANVKDLETRLSQLMGTRVTIQLGRKPNTGKVSMEFFSLDQFEGMLGRLGLRPDQIRFEN